MTSYAQRPQSNQMPNPFMGGGFSGFMGGGLPQPIYRSPQGGGEQPGGGTPQTGQPGGQFPGAQMNPFMMGGQFGGFQPPIYRSPQGGGYPGGQQINPFMMGGQPQFSGFQPPIYRQPQQQPGNPAGGPAPQTGNPAGIPGQQPTTQQIPTPNLPQAMPMQNIPGFPQPDPDTQWVSHPPAGGQPNRGQSRQGGGRGQQQQSWQGRNLRPYQPPYQPQEPNGGRSGSRSLPNQQVNNPFISRPSFPSQPSFPGYPGANPYPQPMQPQQKPPRQTGRQVRDNFINSWLGA